MASKSKRTAARQSNIQGRKKRKDGGKAAVSTIVKQNLTAVNKAKVGKQESITETNPSGSTAEEQVQPQVSVEPSVESSLTP